MKRLVLAAGATILAWAVMLGMTSSRAAAATITVDCTTDPSALASALASASNGDTLAIQGTCRGTFEIAHSVMLAGSPGATLDGQAVDTVLTVESGQTVVVTGLTITNGLGTSPFPGAENGGGIWNDGTLTLTNSTIRGNSTTFSGNGCGIYNTGTLTLNTSTVSNNSCRGAGVGIFNTGTLTLNSSTVSGNVTGFGQGGGIYNIVGTLILDNSTVSGNTAAAGGGVDNRDTATLTNSTISGNTTGGDGGGILNFGTLSLANSTVSGNTASDFFGTQGRGGGIENVGNIAVENVTITGNRAAVVGGGIFTVLPATLVNTIVAGQTAGANCALAGSGSITDGGYNLDDGTSCGFSSATSLSNTNPLLDPGGLQDNGGPTQTIALQPGSPAIDSIPVGANGCGTTITTDQRGVSRPQGSGCDIGAFELVPPQADLSITKTGAPNPVVSGKRLTYTLTVTNEGPGGATGVTVTDPLADSVHFNSVASSQGTCARSTRAPKGGTITCKLGDLANAARASITIVVTTTTPGTLTNTATVSGSGNDPNLLNNSATATTTVIGT